MNDALLKLKSYIQEIKPVWLIVLTTLSILMMQTLFDLLFEILNIPHGSNVSIKKPVTNFEIFVSPFFRFIEVCIIAPIVETFIFQYLFYELLCVKFKFDKKIFIFFTALFFGILHYDYFTTILIITLCCIVFNYLYVVLIETKSKKEAFKIIIFIHASLNAVALIGKYISFYVNI